MTNDTTPREVGSHEGLGPLPEWEPTLEFSERALDRFIYSQEPAGESAEEFRADLAAVIAEAVAAERERCARLCEQMMDDSYTEMHLGGEPADAADCAAAIRRA